MSRPSVPAPVWGKSDVFSLQSEFLIVSHNWTSLQVFTALRKMKKGKWISRDYSKIAFVKKEAIRNIYYHTDQVSPPIPFDNWVICFKSQYSSRLSWRKREVGDNYSCLPRPEWGPTEIWSSAKLTPKNVHVLQLLSSVKLPKILSLIPGLAPQASTRGS